VVVSLRGAHGDNTDTGQKVREIWKETELLRSGECKSQNQRIKLDCVIEEEKDKECAMGTRKRSYWGGGQNL